MTLYCALESVQAIFLALFASTVEVEFTVGRLPMQSPTAALPGLEPLVTSQTTKATTRMTPMMISRMISARPAIRPARRIRPPPPEGMAGTKPPPPPADGPKPCCTCCGKPVPWPDAGKRSEERRGGREHREDKR